MTETRTSADAEGWTWALPSANSRGAHRFDVLRYQIVAVLLALLPILAGLVIGVSLGFAVGVVGGGDPQVRARIAVDPDPALTSPADQSSDVDSFIQAQLLVLNGDDLSAQVVRALQLRESPEVTATQVGNTNVVQLEIRAPTTAESLQTAQGIIDGYRQLRRQDLVARVNASLAVVERQLTTMPATARNDPEYTRLLALRNSLQLARDSDPTQITVVLQPRHIGSSLWARGLRGALIGLVLGGLIGLLVKLVRDRSVVSPDRTPATRS